MNEELQNITLSELPAVYEANKGTPNETELNKLINGTIVACNVLAANMELGFEIKHEDLEFFVNSLIPQQTYFRTLQAITNNMDKSFSDFIFDTGKNNNNGVQTVLNSCCLINMHECSTYNSEHYKQNYEQLLKERNGAPFTVAELRECVDNLKDLCEKSGIKFQCMDDESQLDQPLVETDKAKIHRLAEPDIEEQPKDIEAEVVESNDGYVMNTSERTSDNAAALDAQVKGNEVVHNEAPKITTTDKSKVGGNVKLEEAKTAGTLEEETGKNEGSKNNHTDVDKIDRDEKHREYEEDPVETAVKAAVAGGATKAVTNSTLAAGVAAGLAAKKSKNQERD